MNPRERWPRNYKKRVIPLDYYTLEQFKFPKWNKQSSNDNVLVVITRNYKTDAR